jgi:hypothetical protein
MSERVADVVPLIRGAVRRLDKLDRSELQVVYEQYRTATNEWLRRMIVEQNRIDILARVILNYQVEPFHLAMMIHQFHHRRSLVLSYRGSGKTTICTVCKAIHILCKARDTRILIASESKTSSADILREVKGHFENNERLAEVFGPFYDPRHVSKWDTNAIEIVGRRMVTKEPSIMCAGPDTSITGKHYEVGLVDDLVTEDNARTQNMRDRVKTWYYKTYRPMILIPKDGDEIRGQQHHSGTRYHFNDLMGHLQENDLKEDSLVIPAIDEHGNVPWPDEHPKEYFEKVREESGSIIFESQYQCDTEGMKGEIFEYDLCQELSDKDFPKAEEVRMYMGVDLAADEEERKRNAQFAITILGIKGSIAKDDLWLYVFDFFLAHLRPTRQPEKVLEFYDLYKPLRVGIEVNQYQNYLASHVKEKRPQMVVHRVHTSLDKTTRAWKAAHYFENSRVFFRKSIQSRAIDTLVGLPGSGKWDFFDSLDNALGAAKVRGRKKSTRPSFGLL